MEGRTHAQRRPADRHVPAAARRDKSHRAVVSLTQSVSQAPGGGLSSARAAAGGEFPRELRLRPRMLGDAPILANGPSASMPLPADNRSLDTAGSAAPGRSPASDNAALVAALIRGESRAWNELIDRFGPDVERLVAGALGVDVDLADIVQDVFVRVMERIHQLRDPAALKGWISSVAVFAARGHIRRRRRWRWIRFLAPADIPDAPATNANPETHALVGSTYRVLDTLPENERLAFSLRFIAEMELTEVAAACGCSLATIKRRLTRAEGHFLAGARKDPLLSERIERGERWRSR